VTPEGARSVAIGYIVDCSKDSYWEDRMRCQNGYGTIYAAESHFCKGKVVWVQLCGDGRKLHGKDVMD